MILSFKDAFKKYLTYQEASLKIISVETIKTRFNLHILPFFNNDFLPLDIERIIEFKAYLNNKNISQNYKRTLFINFACFLNFIENTYSIPSNLNKINNFKKERKISRNILTTSQYKQLRTHFNNYEATFFDVLFYGGLRRGEALALKAKNIREKTITIEATYTRKRLTSTKTEAGTREIMLPASIIKALKMHAKEHEGRIFEDLTYTTIKRKFDEALAEINHEPMRIHDIRHSNITILLKAGFTPQAIAKRVGHTNTETLMNVYAEIMNKDDQEISNFLDKTIKNYCKKNGAGDGNRTRVTSLEGWSSTTELRLQNFFFLITGGSDEDRTRDLLRDRETC